VRILSLRGMFSVNVSSGQQYQVQNYVDSAHLFL
jgi:hypothetical protein